MNKKYDTLVLIGRFQPVHMAHVEIIRRAATMARQVVVVIGSADLPRTYKNPFTVDERKTMLRDAVTNSTNEMVPTYIESVRDSMYNDQVWVKRVQEAVGRHTKPGDNVAIIGHSKDESSAYLTYFPQWELIDPGLLEPLHATDIRDLYFKRDANPRYLVNVVPIEVQRFLQDFATTPQYTQIIREREFIEQYKSQFSGLRYPPVFVTVDCCVIQSGHILLVERRSEPGQGLLAMPGGFVNERERLIDAMLRELREETKIKVPAPVLRGCIKQTAVFDHPSRSARGRTITHAFLVELPPGELPRVKGSDDAKTAKWYPLAEVKASNMFEDHMDIIQSLTGCQ